MPSPQKLEALMQAQHDLHRHEEDGLASLVDNHIRQYLLPYADYFKEMIPRTQIHKGVEIAKVGHYSLWVCEDKKNHDGYCFYETNWSSASKDVGAINILLPRSAVEKYRTNLVKDFDKNLDVFIEYVTNEMNKKSEYIKKHSAPLTIDDYKRLEKWHSALAEQYRQKINELQGK